jgi:hypothetical protein
MGKTGPKKRGERSLCNIAIERETERQRERERQREIGRER